MPGDVNLKIRYLGYLMQLPGALIVDETPSAFSALANDPLLDEWLWNTAENATGFLI